MADYETTLRWLSERGDPVGAEELIERVKADLAGDPLVVLTKRREGRPMTKTSQPPTTQERNRPRGPVVGVAAFAIILALFGIYYFASRSDDDNVAEPVPPETDLATIEAGVAAVYSGDADRATELFELESSPYGPDQVWTDQQIRAIAIYEKAIGGRLTLDCTELGTPGEFTCRVPYYNAMTDAVGLKDSGDTNRVVVKDGVITSFGFPEHSGMLLSMAAYLAREVGDEVPQECQHILGPFSEDCVAVQLENLDGWAAFYKTEWSELEEGLDAQLGDVWSSEVCSQPTTASECDQAQWETLTTWAADGPLDADLATIEAGVAAVYSGDADRAAELFELESSPYGPDQVWTDQQIRAIAIYEKAIGGRLTLDCTELGTPGEFTCRVPYYNAMTDAVGLKDSGDTNRVVVKDGVITSFGFPEHSGMLLSMAAYLARELGDEVPQECQHLFGPFTEDCVAVQLENLDGWAAFYKTEWSGLEEGLIAQLGDVWNSEVCSQPTTASECDQAQWEALTTRP